MTTIKWKVGWDQIPAPVEVVSETDHFVTVRESVFRLGAADTKRERRMRKAGAIFNTFAEAKAAIVADAEIGLAEIEKRLLMANDRLARANNLRSPE